MNAQAAEICHPLPVLKNSYHFRKVNTLHPTIRASRILLDLVSDGCLYIIYDRTTTLQELQAIAAQMNNIPYVQAEAIIDKLYDDLNVDLDQELVPIPVSAIFVSLRQCPAAAYAQIMIMLKQLAQPELPIAIAKFELELVICSCSGMTLGVKTLSFISGFEPDDIQSFQLWLLEAYKNFHSWSYLGPTRIRRFYPWSASQQNY
jgi:hypothetical protein